MDSIDNITHEARWLTLRRRVGTASGPDRLRLLGRFADDIRAMSAVIAQTHSDREEFAGTMEVATAQSAILGAWMALDPANPTWPGRDRLFVTSREDLVDCCAALSALGFFRPETVGDMLSRLETDGRDAVIPGIESPGAPPEEIPDRVWESAVESARSKRRWRDFMGVGRGKDWAEPWWRESPAVWRTCALVNAGDPVTDQCRALLSRGGEAIAGLAVFVKASRTEAPALAESWREAGWEAVVVNRSDCLGAYENLVAAAMDKPFALILAIGRSAMSSRISARMKAKRDEPQLLGEMSDEQFSAIMGESLNL